MILPISANVDKVLEGEEALPCMLEVELTNSEDFLLIIETLTRVGVPGNGDKLHQVAHLLRRDDKYYIAHFNQLKGLYSTSDVRAPTKADLGRTVHVAKMLQNWGMLSIINPVQCDIIRTGLVVVPFKNVGSYTLLSHFDFKKVNGHD